MKQKPKHIIQKEVLNISFPDFEAAKSWERNERQQLLYAVQEAIERSFKEYETGDQHFIIDRLELDLGIFKTEELYKEMPERLYVELKEVLTRSWQKFRHTDEQAPDFTFTKARDNIIRERLYSGLQGRLESLLFFLSNGYLPWWASELADWHKSWLQILTPAEWSKLKQFLNSEDKNLCLRLTTQFDDSFLEEVVKGLGVPVNTAEAWQWLTQLLIKWIELDNNPEKETVFSIETLKSFTDSASERRYTSPVQLQALRRKYWYQWIYHAIGKGEIPKLSFLLSGNLQLLSALEYFIKHQELSVTYDFIFKEIPPFWKKEIEQHHELSGKELYKNQSAHTDANDLLSDDKFSPTDRMNENLRQESMNLFTKYDPDDAENIFFINEAGLVLLHPFLSQLFTACEWMEKNRFINAYTQTMAIYALYYMATGETEAPEHQLLLPKLLCSMPWEQPLEAVEPLNEFQKSACEELLTAIIGHWKALKNTSPDGLREAFLQRTGKLEPDENGWHLEIEHKTQDILLSRLPWGISMIKLPWMKDMLFVQWK